jgi:hypothetical protein
LGKPIKSLIVLVLVKIWSRFGQREINKYMEGSVCIYDILV